MDFSPVQENEEGKEQDLVFHKEATSSLFAECDSITQSLQNIRDAEEEQMMQRPELASILSIKELKGEEEEELTIKFPVLLGAAAETPRKKNKKKPPMSKSGCCFFCSK